MKDIIIVWFIFVYVGEGVLFVFRHCKGNEEKCDGHHARGRVFGAVENMKGKWCVFDWWVSAKAGEEGKGEVIRACSDSLASAFRICLSALRGCAFALGETPRADVSTCGSSDSRVGYACGVGSEGGEGGKGNRPPAVVWREGEVRGVGSAQLLEVEVVGLAVGFLVVEVVEAEELGLDFFGTIGKGGAGIAWDGDDDGLLGGEHLTVGADDSLRPYAEYCGVDLGEGGYWGGRTGRCDRRGDDGREKEKKGED